MSFVPALLGLLIASFTFAGWRNSAGESFVRSFCAMVSFGCFLIDLKFLT